MVLHQIFETIDINQKDQEIQLSIMYYKHRGYFANVIPIKKSKSAGFTIIEFGAFTGFNDTLFESGRKSKSSFQKALQVFNANKQKYLEGIKNKILNNG